MLDMTGAVTRGSTPTLAMFSGQSNGPKEMVVFIHLRWGAAFGTPGFTERTSRRRVFTSRRETSSQLPPYITYSFLRRSLPSESELSGPYIRNEVWIFLYKDLEWGEYKHTQQVQPHPR